MLCNESEMRKRIGYLKWVAKHRGWHYVVLMLTVGWLVLAWVYAGKGLAFVGEWMQDVAGA